MDVKFINTTSSKLSSVSIVNGQLIALSDKPSISYDLGGVRKTLSLSDSYKSSAGTATSGVAASSYAVASVYSAFIGKITDMYVDSLLIRGWLTMGMMRGDNSYINIFIPGARVAANGGNLKCSVTSFSITAYHPDGWTTKTLSGGTWTQVETGVRYVEKQSGVGWGGVCTFYSDFTLTPNY